MTGRAPARIVLVRTGEGTHNEVFPTAKRAHMSEMYLIFAPHGSMRALGVGAGAHILQSAQFWPFQ